MGRAPCCEKQGLKKGPWTAAEDEILVDYIKRNGHGSWRSLPKLAGLLRCGKSCRLRWTNYLRPDIKRGPFTPEEEKTIIQLHGMLGNRWSSIASQLPGRTDNEIKNFWNTHLKKRLVRMGLDPTTHAAPSPSSGPTAVPSASTSTRHMAQWESARLEAEARLSKERESLFFSSQSAPISTVQCAENSNPDVFLRIWNSDIGESFRRFNGVGHGREGNAGAFCQSPVSTASSSTAMLATTTTVSNTKSELCGSEIDDVLAAPSDSSCTNELDDSSETSFHLLLNFSGDEIGFF